MLSSPLPSSLVASLPPAGLGVIEGFFGQSWSWLARNHYAQWLPAHGYGFYIYAPKDDACLRRTWWLSWSDEQWQHLVDLRKCCRQNGLAFGIGLTPLGAHHNYRQHRPRLLARIDEINRRLQPDILAVLFDDMPSDTPQLASLQLEIAHDIAAHSQAKRHIFCPSFYSTDPVLERVFGAMPTDYWQTLACGLDSRFDLFWTGPKVCSDSYPEDHLRWVIDTLGRKPFLWDNYPVNDGKKASDYLYLRAFQHRPPSLGSYLAGHAVNPMKQPGLSRLPLASLPLSYALGEHYDADAIWLEQAQRDLGPTIANLLATDLTWFCETGLAQLSTQQHQILLERYQPYADNASVAELLGWLNGNDRFDPACLTG
ncbi:beta-N-acetylglucosaminidase domain-containing protein [Pseudaeromonas sharmana]|uniref:Beta-N-acetylglucosaminidase domain-containing protein n=1 Tax=Pseudaeromonas sharmana TaxID=328412 RepID=A0ABV8CPY3_9GAMM